MSYFSTPELKLESLYDTKDILFVHCHNYIITILKTSNLLDGIVYRSNISMFPPDKDQKDKRK